MTWREAELLLQQPRKPTTPTGPSREALRTMLNAHQYTRAPNGSIHPHASAGASGSGDSQPPAGTDPSAPRDPQPLPPQPPQHTGDKAAAPAIDAHKQRMADNPYTGAQGRPQQTRAGQPSSSDRQPCLPSHSRHRVHRSSTWRPEGAGPGTRQRPAARRPDPTHWHRSRRRPATGSRHPEPARDITATTPPLPTNR